MTHVGIDRRKLLVLGVGGAALGAGAAQAAGMQVPTSEGPVQGLIGEAGLRFLGIPYAAPPVGELRFAPPRPPAKRNGVLKADAFGHAAVQASTPATSDTELGRALQAVFPSQKDVATQSEDCLYLNIWTTGVNVGGKGSKPVMVWLHGGGFAYGSAAWPMYDGANLAKGGDVVVVGINHRLNVFGYTHLPQVEGSGNAGMLDIVQALKWVRANIGAFGGDPGNVTIFGESGGGAKVSYLMAMPSAKGLFHRAVVQSGPGVKAVPAERADALRKALYAELGLADGDVAGLRATAPDQLLSASAAAEKKMPGVGFDRAGFAPVVDGKVLPHQPWDPKAPDISADVPVLIGINKDEMTLFMASAPWFGRLDEAGLKAMATAIFKDKADAVLAALKADFPNETPTYLACHLTTYGRMFAGSVQIAERKAAQGKAKAYFYLLEWETPVGPFKTPHTLEIPLVFDNVETSRPLLGPGPAPQVMARQMSAAWVAFARTGDPNTPVLPAWPAYEAGKRSTMVFNQTSRVVEDPYAATRQAVT
ncbi:carboxylesterase/lipase family protein [Caulobacter sp. NIBR1757]|uniref:carboxylesterase/lipase family protein n=1 Tax=Caulobacter sp. NIBR1757 TaxID=3016000 RepID=UPI0022F0A4BF|nr:carboxylesterase/lipase family protein [Caulobacter sp. NIBR1757]WGM38239.1 Para-nitrobenzyl esterase [Caulobacter sp. NIBR1757]